MVVILGFFDPMVGWCKLEILEILGEAESLVASEKLELSVVLERPGARLCWNFRSPGARLHAGRLAIRMHRQVLPMTYERLGKCLL